MATPQAAPENCLVVGSVVSSYEELKRLTRSLASGGVVVSKGVPEWARGISPSGSANGVTTVSMVPLHGPALLALCLRLPLLSLSVGSRLELHPQERPRARVLVVQSQPEKGWVPSNSIVCVRPPRRLVWGLGMAAVLPVPVMPHCCLTAHTTPIAGPGRRSKPHTLATPAQVVVDCHHKGTAGGGRRE